MHSPGVCGVILAVGGCPGAPDVRLKTKAEVLSGLIDALNADSEMVLVAVGDDSDALAPVVWAKAAYMVQLAESASEADSLRAMLQEVLNRGRDTALVAALDDQALTADTVHRMVTTYCAAGDEIWAVVPEAEMQQGHPVLMGRQMIELFLRGRRWSAASEMVSANLDHVRTVKPSDASASCAKDTQPAAWKAPWD